MHAHDAVADERQRTDVPGLHLVHHQGVQRGLDQLVAAEGNLHAQNVRGVDEALHMLRKAVHGAAPVRALVGANALEDAAAVMQSVGEDVHVGLIPVDELAVHPDLFRFLNHVRVLPSARLWASPPRGPRGTRRGLTKSCTLKKTGQEVKGGGKGGEQRRRALRLIAATPSEVDS